MEMNRRNFIKSAIGGLAVLFAGNLFSANSTLFKAFGMGDKVKKSEVNVADATIYKKGDKVPRAGKYQCIVCGLITEYLSAHIERGVSFGICPLCQAGTANGPKKEHEGFWKAI